MGAWAIRRAFFGWAAAAAGLDFSPPYPKSGSGNGTSIALTFSEALRAGPAFGQFTVTANGVSKAVSAASVAGAVLTLTVATLGGAGVAVVVTYVPGGTAGTRLADASTPANEAAPFTFAYTG